ARGDLDRTLPAGAALDAAGDVDAVRLRLRDGGRHVVGRQPPSEEKRPPRPPGDQRPGRGDAAAPETVDVRVVEPEPGRPARLALERRFVAHAHHPDQPRLQPCEVRRGLVAVKLRAIETELVDAILDL